MTTHGRNPLVAITMCIDRGQRLRPGRDYLYVARAYAACVAQAGGIPLMVGPDANVHALCERVDGLVITGGDDLPSRLPPWNTGSPGVAAFSVAARGVAEDGERIAWDRAAIAAFEAVNKPVFGICYGMQLLNVHFGGSLLLDVRELPSAMNHGGGTEVCHHEITVDTSSSLLAGLPAALSVNSCHRQVVAEVAQGFRITARANDGQVEAIERGGLAGVQWHPETDPSSRLIWRNWVSSC
jgi:putative glutamine amidotransferase